MTLGGFGGLYGGLGQLGASRNAAVAAWYLAGGIAAANCKAAYAPKGSADYAASLVNLANPGTNNATSTGSPLWDATDGWKIGDWGSDWGGYLTGLDLAGTKKTWSAIIRCNQFYPAASHWLFGCRGGSPYSGDNFGINYNGLYSRFFSSGYSADQDATGQVTMAIAGNKGYKDGNAYAGTINGTGAINANFHNFAIGGFWDGSAFQGGQVNCRRVAVQAFAAYDTPLTAAQVAAVSAAMAAL